MTITTKMNREKKIAHYLMLVAALYQCHEPKIKTAVKTAGKKE